MTGRRAARAAFETFLTVGALLGVVCLVLTVAGLAFQIKPLLFRSGSMSPAINTGDLAVARTVDASTLRPGDIVSVLTPTGARVTHRLVVSVRQGDQQRLTLKGDANKTPDAETYLTARADKVLFHVPKVGYAVQAATTPLGMFLGGLYVATLVALIVRRRPPGGGQAPPSAGEHKTPSPRRSAALLRTVTALAVMGSLAIASPAAAAPWVEAASVTGISLTAHTLTPPSSPTCTDKGGVLGLLGSVEGTWTNVDLRYRYQVIVIDVATGSQVGSAVMVDNPGVLGATVTKEFTMGLLNLGLGTKNYDLRVYSTLTNTPLWTSTYVTIPVKTVSLLVGLSLRCR